MTGLRPENQTRFVVLDGWRGVCALLVAAYHFHPNSHIHDWTFLRHGYMVVDFFFDLSGFVLAHAYRSRLSSVEEDRKSTRLNSSHTVISYAVFCLKKKKKKNIII